MIKINLVPSEILAKAQQRQQNIQAAAVAVFLAAVVILLSLGRWATLKNLESTLGENHARLKKLEIVVAKVEELERTAAAVRARLNVMNDLLKSRPVYPYFMSDFVRSVPLGVRITNLNTAGGGSTAGPLKLNMTAESRSNEDIASWVKNMEQSGKFSLIELGAVTTAEGAERSYSFTLTTVYTPTL
ncbi:MAG: hypothetical protein A3J74_01565 [Elusimicrobia bacterium RIFCSPHIGHO2_02_FULL_57_9]|nr:MAG: hypothetical protein A3J74_01565 [Elusimicrobia bacterium RIFCSPHIGHO2_02_FULL_57_9]